MASRGLQSAGRAGPGLSAQAEQQHQQTRQLQQQQLASLSRRAPAQRSIASRRRGPVQVQAIARWDKLLGGRGLVREDVLKDEQRAKETLWSAPPREKAAEEAAKLGDLPPGALEEGFGKEMAGLTGGFPGGETGLKEFIRSYPPPAKQKLSPQLEAAKQQLSAAAAAAVSKPPAPLAPPLFMPGMTVMVVNPTDAYFQYTGIVQRISDGRVAVLFEGGNWDKLVTFDLTDLERTKKGPPGINPKSASLELNPIFKRASPPASSSA